MFAHCLAEILRQCLRIPHLSRSASIKLQGMPMEVVQHALLRDGKDPSIVDPDFEKSGKQIQGLPVGTVRGIKKLDAEKSAPPNEDPAYAKVSAKRSKHSLNEAKKFTYCCGFAHLGCILHFTQIVLQDAKNGTSYFSVACNALCQSL